MEGLDQRRFQAWANLDEQVMWGGRRPVLGEGSDFYKYGTDGDTQL